MKDGASCAIVTRVSCPQGIKVSSLSLGALAAIFGTAFLPTVRRHFGYNKMETEMPSLAFSLVTWSGPIIGAIGLYAGWQWFFWLGVALAGFNLFMNIASGAMRLPVLPIGAMALGGLVWVPWTVGVGLGLLVWTAIEAAGELLHLAKR